MEIVTATPSNGSPFRNHDVREWSRLDSITGVLERARLETDHWTANTATTSHKYNKVVDSRARSGADGALQQQARRKLEVFQSQVPGGRLQVIKTQTVASSRWSTTTTTTSSTATNDSVKDTASSFGDLKLSLNPLDLTSEKAKASVGRGVGRRPPSRSRIREDARSNPLHVAAATVNLHRVSRLCHQIHNSAVRETFGTTTRTAAALDEREAGDGIEITEIHETDSANTDTTGASTTTTNHSNLTRTKSSSSEDLFEKKRQSTEDLKDLEQLQSWRRTSKIRRSLQYPKQKEPSKPPDLPPATGNVRKIKEDLETGRRLSTALRGNTVDLDALDQILKSISNSSISSTQSEEKTVDSEDGGVITPKKQKRDSFVTVESIQAVRDRLRRTSSPSIGGGAPEVIEPAEDDGIVSDKPVNLQQLDIGELKMNISGTGSLESRSKLSNAGAKQDDWFARRKSYGFEQMHHAGGGNALQAKKSRNESSTDSGICRSTEIPTSANTELDINDVIKDDNVTNVKKYAMIFENKNDSAKHPQLLQRNRSESGDAKRHSIAVDESKYMPNNGKENQFKRTSLVLNDATGSKEDDARRTNKKVEFCKTEVHFAADSGRVNIVETDEKPPPTQRFRRRRRNSGPSDEEVFHRAGGLPVQRFGDSSYEKFLFGDVPPSEEPASNGIYENLQEVVHAQPVGVGNVTVNASVPTTNGYYELDEEPQRDTNGNESEALRGILKNKPLKPKPFLLGTETDGIGWHQETTPLWKSTVTLKNNDTIANLSDEPKEFQKMRQHLRPTSKRMDFESAITSLEEEEVDGGDSQALKETRLFSLPIDERSTSWSVADRIKQVEEMKWTENKGYSTKVNFGDGEATVVENRHTTTWPRKEECKATDGDAVKKRNMLNKGLVVRIGHNNLNGEMATKHKVCSTATMTTSSNHTTTTKITIDLTPSPTTHDDGDAADADFKFPRAAIGTFKSPSLIMSAFKRTDAFLSTSMHDIGSSGNRMKLPQLEDLKRMYEDANSDTEEADKEVHRILMNSADDDDYNDDLHEHYDYQNSVLSGSWSKLRAMKHAKEKEPDLNSTASYKYKLMSDQIEKDLKYLNQEVRNLNLSNRQSQVDRSSLNTHHEQLSSPFLVGQSRSRTNSLSSDLSTDDFAYKKTDSPKPSSTRFVGQSVLRQPKKSEMAYFGVHNATKHTKLSEKPDLLQFNNKKFVSSAPPIYENLAEKSTTFDSSILEELTKAADEILLAVNGYTDEERSRLSTDDELRARRRNEKLETITENKSWKQTQAQTRILGGGHTLSSRLRADRQKSSNSSIDSITRDVHRSFEQLDSKRTTTTTTSSAFTKSNSELKKAETRRIRATNEANVRTSTKQRRLQRASSREALLQSHGSSSEDLPNNTDVVIRKPRLIKRTKTAQLNVTNGLEVKKATKSVITPVVHNKTPTKHTERTVGNNLPEIRHKTAVSTIRSTAEKQAAAAASRERAKLKRTGASTIANASSGSAPTAKATHKVSHPQTATAAAAGRRAVAAAAVVDRRGRDARPARHTAISNQTAKKIST